jgi:flagellar P-ring protein precursor FlgI
MMISRGVVSALVTVALAGTLATGGRDVLASPVRVKDVARLHGVQSTQLLGYGLVVGLSKTGDRRQTIFPAQTLANLLENFGVAVPADQFDIQNVAAVLVTAELPPFVRSGFRIDVTISSIGDAKSLQGGTLLVTPLRGLDGSIYVMAQGPLTLGGFGGGGGGNSVTVNHLTVGRVPGGGLVQVSTADQMPDTDSIQLSLNEPDYVTATRLAETINVELGGQQARAVDQATVSIDLPDVYRSSVPDLMARLEPLAVEVDGPARVVINERTGTVVVGALVRIGPAAIAHGSLSVRISTSLETSQPPPFSGGDTVTVPEQEVDVLEGDSQLIELEEGTTLQAVVSALNSLGATPRDIIAIMQSLKAVGALRAELVII